MKRWLFPALATLVLLGAGAVGLARGEGDTAASPRPTMQRVFAVLDLLLPDALDAERYADPARRDAIGAELDLLATQAHHLEEHGRTRDADFAWLGGALARDLAQSRDAFARGDVDESRYLLLVATRHCVACHSRLPAARDFPLASRLTDEVEVRDLDRRSRAHFYVVTRSFEAALSTWEAMFADPDTTTTQIETGGALFDYLTIAIRVENDSARARRTLERFAKRPTLSAPLRATVKVWIAALAELGDALTGPPDLERAHAIVDEATGMSLLPEGRERAVHDLVASSLLYRWLDQHRDPASASDRQRALAWYLLGVIEARSAEAYWVPRTEYNLERAIRLDPKGPNAPAAWRLLEQTVAGAYGGVDGPSLPPEVRARLLELRALIDG